MRIDRRGFFRLVGGTLTLMRGGGALAVQPPTLARVHHATRNTRSGPVGPRRRSYRPLPFKAYADVSRIALPAAGDRPQLSFAEAVHAYQPARGFLPAELPLHELSRLLQLTNGVTGRAGSTRLRAAPSAGALYAGEIYVAAERVGGLGPGLYYYAAFEHALVALRSGRPLEAVGRTLERPAALEGAAAVVLLTNVFARYQGRYANRGYRYALIDTGHIAENLRLAARAAGWGDAAFLRFHDDALNAFLGIDGREESVCLLHAVGATDPVPDTPAGITRQLVEKKRGAPRTLLGDGRATDLYHDATKLVPGTPRPETTIEPQPPAPGPGDRVPLPEPAAAGAEPLAAVISRRRSAATFEPRPLSRVDLSSTLDLVRGHAALERAPGVELYVAVHRVEDLEPGLYRHSPDAGLFAVRPGDLRESMVRACLGQAKAGSADVGCLLVFQPEWAGRRGERTYRDLLIEAGAVAQRIYLAAEARGLAARNLAAFVDAELNELLDFDRQGRAVLHLTMLGHGT